MLLNSFFTVAALRLLLFSLGRPTHAAPITSSVDLVERQSSDFWMANIQRQGTVPFSGSSGYKVFRNVKDYGAKGDGSSDDTAAINSAITDGNRCGQGCDSSTTTPALVYFPPGTYVVSTPIVQLYYTQLVGDATSPPTIKAAAGFTGIAVIDSDPYADGGNNWYTNQNNFFRQVRNFVIDLTGMPQTAGAGIHWQVAQATSLQNIVFNMIQGGDSKQEGIFMDNGSGGWMEDLVFNGGNYGAFLGNQQFTTRNLTFNNCNTAIFMNWNWVWALKSVEINNCGVGIDMANSPQNQTVGSVLLQDSKISNTPIGIKTAYSTSNDVPTTGGTLIIDNVDFTSCQTAVADNSGNSVLAGGSVVSSFVQGRAYSGSSGSPIQKTMNAPSKPANLLSGGNIFERSKPQYEGVSASSFVSVKSAGAKGDGSTDDTQAIQNAMNGIQSGQVLYFDHGAYVVSSTIKVPSNIHIVGEIWPLIMAKGDAFQDPSNPAPVFQVGQPGDTGDVEMSDLIFETIGPQPGAILMEWNVAGSSQGSAGIFDVHFRIGGTAGTNLQSDTCAKNPSVQAAANPACEGAFLLFHETKSGSVYMQNTWAWVSDHELDLSDHSQINIFNGRGILLEGTQASWLYGTSAEHSVIYNYGLNNAQNVYMSIIQSETPYFQSNPAAPAPFTTNSNYGDPTFSNNQKAWGLNIIGSSDVLIYGTGLYSFFDNYDQTCLNTEDCQPNMINVQQSSGISLYGVSTKAASDMITADGNTQAQGSDNMNNFCQTVAMWSQS